jgi:twitching motility two-component system response regulator PilG
VALELNSDELQDAERGVDQLLHQERGMGLDDFAGLKVMVIDDSKTIRRTAENLLKKQGCEVVTATDGFEALAKIAEHKPDIIFVDIMMPRLDGYQTCALIKNNRTFRETPVIMLSSKDSIFDKARGRIVGSEQYLTKPFTKDDLLNAIKVHAKR